MTKLKMIYSPPSDFVIANRKIFYSSQKVDDESIGDWLWRIRDYIDNCEFGELAEFLLIDKFVCELDKDEIYKFKNIELWSLDQLMMAIEYQKNAMETQTEQTNTINNISKVKLDIVSTRLWEIIYWKIVKILFIQEIDSFKDENEDISDSEDKELISEIKREIGRKEKNHERKSLETKESIENSSKNRKSDERFIIDEENRFHCLDCGKNFTRKASYVQHSRLLV